MLELKEHAAKLTNLNLRAERHGDEMVPAADLHLQLRLPNDMLDALNPQLRALLFRAPDSSDAQQQVISTPDHMPSPRFPDLAPVKWQHEYTGYSLRVHYGIDDKSDIVLDGCKINKMTIACEEGGYCPVQMRVQAHPDEVAVGHLYKQVNATLSVSLIPPTV